MVGDDIGTLGDQSLGSFPFLARIKPGVDPDDFDFNIGIHRFGAQSKSVDAPQNFGDRKGGNITQSV